MIYFDHLLGMPNGMKLEEDINELASVETVALVYFEIERLEEINDLYGWENGDNLLKQIRDWLYISETRRAQFYRVNNGFAMLGRKTSMKDAQKRAKEIQDRFSQPWILPTADNDLQLYCTIKLGIVYGKYIRNEMRNLVLRTIRLAENTKAGYAVYDEQADRQAKRALMIRNTLINCVRNDMQGFEVHYQPIVEIRSQRWIALEALCRWTTPEGEKISPVEFIRLAEQLNLIHQVDAWVRKTAMHTCVALKLDKKDFVLDINFSPMQQIDDTFIDGLLCTLDETAFPPQKLNLEITESAKMVFDESNLNGLNRLQQNGIILSLDDFGTGYSSFANLIKMPAKVLKTEKMFLDDIEKDPYRQHLLNMLAELAHYHEMHLVAEGVETIEQYELLKKYAVDCAQGYLFSTPLPYEQLRQQIDRFN